jgi:hypothetical protein
MQQIYSRPKSKTKKTSQKKRRVIGKKNITQVAGDGENGQPNQVPAEEQPNQVPDEAQATQPTDGNVVDNSASTQATENAGNGIGLNRNSNNQRSGVYTKETPPEKTGIEKKINSIRSGLSFHVPTSAEEINRSKNEVMASISGEKIPGFLPSTSDISGDMIPKIFYRNFYPQNSISYQLNLPEPDQEKMETAQNQNTNQSNA